MFEILSVTCGNIENLRMNEMVPQITSTIYNAIRIGVPLLLIFFGMLDLGKAVMAQKEDEIKKGQQTFFKRLIAAIIVFLVFFVVEIVVGLVAPKDDNANIMNCVECFIKGEEKCEPAN